MQGQRTVAYVPLKFFLCKRLEGILHWFSFPQGSEDGLFTNRKQSLLELKAISKAEEEVHDERDSSHTGTG